MVIPAIIAFGFSGILPVWSLVCVGGNQVSGGLPVLLLLRVSGNHVSGNRVSEGLPVWWPLRC